jgi:hypothetical protein
VGSERQRTTVNPIVLHGHDGLVRAVAIRWVVTGSDDDKAWLWDLEAKDPAANPIVLRGHDEPVGVAISPWLVAISPDRFFVADALREKH